MQTKLILALQHAIKIGDVADGEAEDLDLGELLVRRQGGQERSQRAEGRVERLNSEPLPGSVSHPVL